MLWRPVAFIILIIAILSKRFQGDKLQRSYQSFADQFGFTKRMVTDALKRLKSQGIITLELRTINTSIGTCSNVLFIEPVPARIQEITNATQLVNNQPDLESVSAIEHKKNVIRFTLGRNALSGKA